MENQQKQKKGTELGMFFLSVALLFFVFGFLSVNKKVVQALDFREQQVSSLTQGFSELRQENILLKNKLEKQGLVFERIVKKSTGSAVAGSVATAPAVNAKTSAGISAAAESAVAASNAKIEYILVAGHHKKLTDTIMLAALDHAKSRITLVSIPRDFSIGGMKSNEYYFSYGALELVKQVEKIFNVSIDHYVIVSMEAFERFIDALGGVNIEIPKSIYDPLFPDDRLGYESFSIKAGIQTIDGKTALKYARSRHGNSDFDRAGRQQEVMRAVFRKVKNIGFLRDLSLAKKVYESVGSLFETDIGLLDILFLLQRFHNADIRSGNVLSTENFLYPTRNMKEQYILLPKKSDYSDIRNYLLELLTK